MQRPTAFSLIELLVTLSVITLLIAILLPALTKAREATRTTGCLSNLRQVGIAAWSHESSNRGIIPFGSNGAGSSAHSTQNHHSNVVFQAFAREYLQAPATGAVFSTGALRCPGRVLNASSLRPETASYHNGHAVFGRANRYNDLAFGPNGWRPRVEGATTIRDAMRALYGPFANPVTGAAVPTFANNMNLGNAQSASALPLMFDDTLADGMNAWMTQVNAHGVARTFNHGSESRPQLNALYADGSATNQAGDPLWIADYDGRYNTGNSATFRTWYMPYIRAAPMPYLK